MLAWLYNKLRARYEMASIKSASNLARPHRTIDYSVVESQNPIQFTVIKAKGGHVVEFRHYDSKTDRTSGGLYIITDQEDFSAELGKLVMMECLSR